MQSAVSSAIKEHLGIEDQDLTLSGFIINLYNQALESPDKIANFRALLLQNGGDFPPAFIDSVILILHSPVKKEFNALSLPDRKVSFDDEELSVQPEIDIKREEQDSAYIIQEEQDSAYIKQEDGQDKQPIRVKRENPTGFGAISHGSRNTKIDPSKPLVEGEIYQGIVTNITKFGAFIKINYHSGLCHISQISFDGSIRIRLPYDILKLEQQVYVKVLLVERDGRRQKISLSMRGIDQATGLDRSEELQQERGRVQVPVKQKRRLTSPERWEIRQMIASGAAKAEDYPELNGVEELQTHIKPESEVQVDVQLLFKEPKFLQGQTTDVNELEPSRIIKNPEGLMRRAALKGSNLAKELKEQRIKETKEKEREQRLRDSRNPDAFDPLKRTKESDNVAMEWKKSQANVTYGKRTSMTIKQQRESLPVYGMRQQLVDKIRENQFLVIVGETGSGKTTQIAQYLAEEGFNRDSKNQHKIIACTQPRRVAAVSVAKRVAEERGSKLGGDVGYTIRFEDVTSPNTNIKYMTDGMLQREAINDPIMSKYSVIMLDEAHERTIATDVLFALLKKAVLNNPHLKVIITSATLDSKKFSLFFNNCPIITIPGRTFPVEILYTKEPEMDYLSAALDSVIQIHVSEPKGDILVFLTGQEEIDTSCEVLYEKVKALGDNIQELIILPVYSSLPSEMQSRIFEPTPEGSRKVILATNIAETSITIDGIYYVIDPGFVKLNAYDPKLGMDTLMVSPISQAQANQRSGRAGRTGPGKCYRLYTEKAYKEEMMPNTIPEIQRTNLSNTILLLKAMGINDLLNFEFMDPPKATTLLNALQDLYILGALDDEGYLTRLGKRMSDFPMEPKLSKTLIKSVDYECSEEILTIVSMLSVQTIFYRPKDKQNLADQRKARFKHSSGDHLTLLNVYRSWVLNGYNKRWCQENFIQERSMRKAQEVKAQLTKIMRKNNQNSIVSCGLDSDKIIQAICSGFFKNSAKRDHQEGYKTLVENTPVYLHPSSSLQGKDPDYVVYHTLLLTTKEYMHCVTSIDAQQLIESAPNYFQKADNSSRKKQKIVPLYDKFKGDDSWRLSSHINEKKRALGQNSK